MRTRSAIPLLGGMKSRTTADPLSVWNRVSRINVPGRYRRLDPSTGWLGESCQCPLCSPPSMAAQQAGASKRGMHSQSMEALRETMAAVCRSPIIA